MHVIRGIYAALAYFTIAEPTPERYYTRCEQNGPALWKGGPSDAPR